MDVSIYNSVRGNKVTTGNAAQYQGMRTFDNTAQVCPPRSNVSDYGVAGVSRDSINTYTAGCFDPMDRMEVENLQRPRYATYLNAAAISAPGVGDEDYGTVDFQYGASKPYYDTQLGNQYVRPVESRDQMFPEYQVGQLQLAKGATDNAQLREANYVNCMMSREGEQRYCDANKAAMKSKNGK